MGGETSSRNKRNFTERITYIGKVLTTYPRDVVHQCSYEKWLKNYSSIANCADTADYSCIGHKTDFRNQSFGLRSDTLEGRLFKASRVSPITISVEEKSRSSVFYIQESYTSGKLIHPYTRSTFNNLKQRNLAPDGIGIIGCRGKVAVAQVLDRVNDYIPEFYILDMSTSKCMGKFTIRPTTHIEMMWYECFISPDTSTIILRPDMNTYGNFAKESFERYKVYNHTIIAMYNFATYAMCYDNRHPKRYIFRAKYKTVECFDLDTMRTTQMATDLAVPAPIRQIKPSASGVFIALRCTNPMLSSEFQTNSIAVLSTNNLHSVLLLIDASGSYWRSSHVIHLEVFPQFSACDTTIAAMKHEMSTRRIFLYKLPFMLTTLQHMCRKVIRLYIQHCDISLLMLPNSLKRFLLYDSA